MVVHLGTHVDAPRHFFSDGPAFHEIPLDRLHGGGVVWRIDKEDDGVIDVADLERARPRLQPGDILALDTGWARHFGTPRYDRHPSLSVAAAEWLVAQRIKMLAVDMVTPDLPVNRRRKRLQLAGTPRAARPGRAGERARQQPSIARRAGAPNSCFSPSMCRIRTVRRPASSGARTDMKTLLRKWCARAAASPASAPAWSPCCWQRAGRRNRPPAWRRHTRQSRSASSCPSPPAAAPISSPAPSRKSSAKRSGSKSWSTTAPAPRRSSAWKRRQNPRRTATPSCSGRPVPTPINPGLYERLPYDAVKDFVPISLMTTYPYVMVVNPADPGDDGEGTGSRNLAKSKPDQAHLCLGLAAAPAPTIWRRNCSRAWRESA